jgi:hypothetical protein
MARAQDSTPGQVGDLVIVEGHRIGSSSRKGLHLTKVVMRSSFLGRNPRPVTAGRGIGGSTDPQRAGARCRWRITGASPNDLHLGP